ncbi:MULTISPECIES: hypothetical protein [unclassified Xanthobacter]|uniref:hypothetical protein n=1 Tax=unclassified Xanthobacter TaxID=2623496 RepID=UPI001F1927C8|nr:MULTISPECIES: hypothetical protein [unclassified Xanthobacter]
MTAVNSEPPSARLLTAAVKNALAYNYRGPAHAILFEVADSTGAAACRRADAIAMSLWPSRGLNITGFEVKVARSDFMREMKKPEKADIIARYCDAWVLVSTPGVVRNMDELPPTWGWMELQDIGNTILTTHRKAPERHDDNPAQPVDRQFLAALMRRAGQVSEDRLADAIEEMEKRLTNQHNMEQRVEAEVHRRLGERTALEERVSAFEQASGLDLRSGKGHEHVRKLGRAVKAMLHAEVEGSTLPQLLSYIEMTADCLREGMQKFGIPTGGQTDLLTRHASSRKRRS